LTTREEVLKYCLSFSDTYQDAPFHDENWRLVRYRKNEKVFAWTYFREGRDYVSMMKEVPLYHQMNGGISLKQRGS